MSDSEKARIVDETIERIAANDPSLTLTSIYLNENESIDAAACVRIAEALRGNTHLTLLLLRFNGIDHDGASALAEVLKSNTTLIKLDLNRNDIGPVGASALAEVLKSNTTLIKLSLSYNDIGDGGASALAEMLKSNTSLAMFFLNRNDIGDIGALALVEALQSNATLERLYLNDINDAIHTVLMHKIDRLIHINWTSKSEELARRRKTTLRIEWMLDAEDEDEDEGGAQCEAAVALALEEMRSFPEAAHRQELLSTLLSGAAERGVAAAAVETVPRGRALYRYAAECGATPAVLVNVLRAHPSLCGTCRDINHKLYPFMLLAALPEARTGDVMEMLLQCPSLVERGISNPIGRGVAKRKRVDGGKRTMGSRVRIYIFVVSQMVWNSLV